MANTTIASCPTCGGYRNADILAEQNHRTDGAFFEPEWTQTKYYILACRGCDTRYFVTLSTNADDFREEQEGGEKTGKKIYNETVNYYPSSNRRRRPEWSNNDYWTKEQKLRDIVDEMYTALNNELPVLAAIGMRTVFDTAIEILGIDPGGTFKEKLDAILALGKISTEERKLLDTLIDAGSAAAHRGWKPEDWQLDTMALILEGFLHRAFVLPTRASHLKSIPAKPGKRT